MTREEEIKQAIKDICSCEFCKFDKDYCPFCKERNVTIEAINWADQHPRKGLWDAEKICSFIEENIDNYLYINRDWNAPQIKSNFIEDLKKAMEE